MGTVCAPHTVDMFNLIADSYFFYLDIIKISRLLS